MPAPIIDDVNLVQLSVPPFDWRATHLAQCPGVHVITDHGGDLDMLTGINNKCSGILYAGSTPLTSERVHLSPTTSSTTSVTPFLSRHEQSAADIAADVNGPIIAADLRSMFVIGQTTSRNHALLAGTSIGQPITRSIHRGPRGCPFDN